MVKKIYTVLIFLLTFTLSFSSNIKNVRFNSFPTQVVFDLDETKPIYISEYDETSRTLFVEVGGVTDHYDKKVTNKLPKYVESIQEYKYDGSHGFFLKLQKNIFHKVSIRKNPNRLVIDLSKSRNIKQYTVVIDPGHGGKDSGAIGIKNVKEKDIVLNIGKYLRDELKEDFNVVMTRDRDEFISLTNRSRIANKKGADIFISIHANSSNQSSHNGMEIFYFSKKSSPYAASVARYENSFGEKYGENTSSIVQIAGEIAYNKNQEKSIPFASNLTKNLSKTMGMRNRGIHGANFAVLRGVNCPGILIEVGFIKSPKDYSIINSRSHQKKMAKNIADHIRNYFY